MSKRPPSLYTIERESNPLTTVRYFSVFESGETAWVGPALDFLIFDSARDADAFIAHRMGAGADDVIVVRHSIN